MTLIPHGLRAIPYLVLSAGIFSVSLLAYYKHSQAAPAESPATQAESSPLPLEKRLSPLQYEVTQQGGTEAPFANPYWNNHEDGIYVDVVDGKPLFSSLDKYDSGTGWPSFTRPLEASGVKMREDHSLGADRTEVRSSSADSHLGHVFDDGPGPGGKRFCMNSAALRFVPLDQLEAQGLGRYLFLFAQKKHWETAILGGGCFWGMENILRKLPGVIQTEVGYDGGTAPSVSYEDVSTGTTGYAESVHILFDPQKLSYEKLLTYFFQMHDPTTLNRQENDVGTQYRSAIFYLSDAQKQTAEKMKAKVEHSGKWGKPVVTQIVAATPFVRAEDYHQKYLVKHPHGYNCHFLRKMSFD